MKRLFLLFIVSFFLIGCLKSEPTKDISYYKKVFEDTFKNYQKNATKIPKKGKFDFEFTTLVTGNKQASEFGIVSFGEKFSSFSVKFFGEHDFTNKENSNLEGTIRIYLNKRSFGMGDLDIKFKIDSSGDINYAINNLNKNVLKFFNLDSQSMDMIMLSYDENKGKTLSIKTYSNLIKEFIQIVENSSKSSPLVKNTKTEESKIIDAFIKNEVLKVVSGKEISDDINKLDLNFDPANFVNFLNEVAIILKEKKDFSGDKKTFKDYKLIGSIDIKDNKIVNSLFLTEFPVSSVDSKTGEQKFDLIILKNNFKMPNPEKFDIDLTTLFYSKSKQENKLQIRLRGIIK